MNVSPGPQAPISGVVTEVNEKLEGTPNLVNESALEDGWFIKVKMADSAEAALAVRACLLPATPWQCHVRVAGTLGRQSVRSAHSERLMSLPMTLITLANPPRDFRLCLVRLRSRSYHDHRCCDHMHTHLALRCEYTHVCNNV